MTEWATFTKRTEDPKLAWLEKLLDVHGIPHRRNGESWHAQILEVYASDLERADALLAEVYDYSDDGKETPIRLDDIEDDDPMFDEPPPGWSFRHLIKGDDLNETKAGKGASLIRPTYSYLSPVFSED